MQFASQTIEQVKWGKAWTIYTELFIYTDKCLDMINLLMNKL
jgi:hypothetical protein